MLLVTLSESAATLEGAITKVLGFKATLFLDKSRSLEATPLARLSFKRSYKTILHGVF